MSDHTKTPLRRHQRTHVAGLLSRLIPAAVLAVGAIVWMTHLQVAFAQYPQNNSARGYQTGAPIPGQPGNFRSTQPQYDGGIPVIPASATIPSNDPIPAEPEDAESTWQAPAFVAKIAEGGWLMVPLAICSLIVFALSLERLVALRRGRVIPRPFVRRFTECVEDGQLSYEEATELCEEFDCPVAEVFQAAVRRWGRPMFEIEQAVMDAGDRVADGLKRFLRVFHAISNVAPLIGLLGTVLGMIEAFETISSQASIGRPEMLASGISVALMTTAGGLSVAIPAYLAYMYFSSKSDRYLGEIDKLCQRVIDCISAEGLENSGSQRSAAKKRRAA
ncbi:MotA/TolQ/ExbB proton channel family protein [Novipirellula artificiosorum]|uniref:Colicin uptake protein TolQ n=1 Tax=Novipirellula artificiosorum TaxID=2528016 RepID=A0A5C6DF28_9BACT|nr:MotA/TolQ/ExbB proton channel family protein [Novipirellula artificiosorum]TWU34427.1 colicin uptake protein TolQ [Novipirellula artificiosorum]